MTSKRVGITAAMSKYHCMPGTRWELSQEVLSEQAKCRSPSLSVPIYVNGPMNTFYLFTFQTHVPCTAKWILSHQTTREVPIFLLNAKPRSPALQADSLPPEPSAKPKNTGVGSLSLTRGSSRPRSQTRVSCMAGRFFTS